MKGSRTGTGEVAVDDAVCVCVRTLDDLIIDVCRGGIDYHR
eukprot:COSAG01_NODE_6500_length_3630_cov_10.141886_2_plen_41_part_00